MSHLSKQKSIKRKCQRRKERNKQPGVGAGSAVSVQKPEVRIKNGLKITTIPIRGQKRWIIQVGNRVYRSVADFSVEPDWIRFWGYSRGITEDVFGQHIVYWKERFPLFDEFDYNLDDRHFRVMLICSSKEDAEQKLAFIQNENPSITRFGHHQNLFEEAIREEYWNLAPLVYFEDSVKAIVVEPKVTGTTSGESNGNSNCDGNNDL